jgi:LPS-assembly protein
MDENRLRPEGEREDKREGEGHKILRGIGGAVLCFVLCFTGMPAFADVPPASVILDAERVSYDDATARVSAQGNAVLTYQDATVRAERIDYDAVTQKVKASSLPGQGVSLQNKDGNLMGDGLEYDLNTGEGVLTGARSNVPVGEGTLYISGGGLQVLPYSLAVERGLVRARQNVSYTAIWENVSATTCALDHPHYRIETKKITVVPGRHVVAKKPRLYLGNTFIFTYPLDYIVQIDRKATQHSITPYVQHSGEKGTGVGLSGALTWETGSVNLGVSYWTDVDLEWTASVVQSLGDRFSIETGVEYSWDSAWNEKIYHPRASLHYEYEGWRAALRWSKDEYIEDRKSSLYKYKGRLDRKPEFTLSTPWFDNPVSRFAHLRLGVAWGDYQDKTPNFTGDVVMRYGVTLHSYFEMPLGKAVQFFSNSRYGAWFYDKDNSDQEVVEGLWGLRYNLGAVELASGYERRYVWGESPLLWDGFHETERLHQKIRFPVGREWFVAARGSYDLSESMVDEVNYALQWINDCMKWEVLYHHDYTTSGENRLSLNISILAFPNTPASFGERKDVDPFDRPQDLPK